MNRIEALDKVDRLVAMYKSGALGGEVMPEDANPKLEKSSLENYLYFTLPMALNYQRNSRTYRELKFAIIGCTLFINIQTGATKIWIA